AAGKAGQWSASRGRLLAHGLAKRTGTALLEVPPGVGLLIANHIGISQASDMMEYVCPTIGQFGEPHPIEGDWNACPEALLESRWVDQIGGVVLAADDPTCGESEYDYVV
ncbi:unnamed protein product, partial [Prorocentrum cordatum]